MPGDELCHLKHSNLLLASKKGQELLICNDVALVGWVLKIVLLDVDPYLLNYFTTAHRALAYDGLKLFAKLHGL